MRPANLMTFFWKRRRKRVCQREPMCVRGGRGVYKWLVTCVCNVTCASGFHGITPIVHKSQPWRNTYVTLHSAVSEKSWFCSPKSIGEWWFTEMRQVCLWGQVSCGYVCFLTCCISEQCIAIYKNWKHLICYSDSFIYYIALSAWISFLVDILHVIRLS